MNHSLTGVELGDGVFNIEKPSPWLAFFNCIVCLYATVASVQIYLIFYCVPFFCSGIDSQIHWFFVAYCPCMGLCCKPYIDSLAWFDRTGCWLRNRLRISKSNCRTPDISQVKHLLINRPALMPWVQKGVHIFASSQAWKLHVFYKHCCLRNIYVVLIALIWELQSHVNIHVHDMVICGWHCQICQPNNLVCMVQSCRHLLVWYPEVWLCAENQWRLLCATGNAWHWKAHPFLGAPWKNWARASLVRAHWW